MRKANSLFRRAQETIFKGLSTLLVARPVDTFLHLLLRDIGATKRLDWRASEKAAGRQWKRKSLWTRYIEDNSSDSDAEQQDGFTPTINSFYAHRKEPMYRMCRGLSAILNPKLAEAEVELAGADQTAESNSESEMDALRLLIKTCPDIEESELIQHLRTSTFEAISDVDIRSTAHYEGLEDPVTGSKAAVAPYDLTILVSDHYTNQEKIQALIKLCQLPECDIDKYFSWHVIQALKKLLSGINIESGEQINEAQIDWVEVKVELDLLLNWARETMMSTKPAEVLHRFDRNAARALGCGHSHDIMNVQNCFVLGLEAQDFLSRRKMKRLPNYRKEAMLSYAAQKAKKAKNKRGGNVMYYFMGQKRKAWAETGGVWLGHRDILEDTWKREWADLDTEQYAMRKKRWLEYKRGQGLARLDTIAEEFATTDLEETDAGYDGDTEPVDMADATNTWVVAPSYVDATMERNVRYAPRKGVRGLVARFKEKRRVYVPDPGEGKLQVDKMFLRCCGRHPGFCLHIHAEVDGRVRDIHRFLESYVPSKDRVEPEPMLLIESSTSEASERKYPEGLVFSCPGLPLMSVARFCCFYFSIFNRVARSCWCLNKIM